MFIQHSVVYFLLPCFGIRAPRGQGLRQAWPPPVSKNACQSYPRAGVFLLGFGMPVTLDGVAVSESCCNKPPHAGCLKATCHTVLDARSLASGCGGPALCPPRAWRLEVFLGWWPRHSPGCHITCLLPRLLRFSESCGPLCLSQGHTSLGLATPPAPPRDPGLFHLEIFSFTASVKTVYPNKFTCTGSRD